MCSTGTSGRRFSHGGLAADPRRQGGSQEGTANNTLDRRDRRAKAGNRSGVECLWGIEETVGMSGVGEGQCCSGGVRVRAPLSDENPRR